MATRFYLPSTGAAPVSPVFWASWEKSDEADRVEMVRAKISSAFATKACTEALADPTDILNRQYVSAPIGIHDFTGCTWKTFIRCVEDLAKMDAKLVIAVRVVSNDGNTIRFELSDAMGATEFAYGLVGNLENRTANDTVSANTSQNGDRIVVEIGANAPNGKTTLYTATMDFGDNSGTDLPENETETAQYNPWIEFTHDIPVMTHKLEGISKDKDGDALGSCLCFLCKDNQNNSCSYIAYVLSNSVTGAYSFTGITDSDPQYFVISWKDDSPHVFDVTDHVLQPVVE